MEAESKYGMAPIEYAFPNPPYGNGMTLRDYFAAQTIKGIIGSHIISGMSTKNDDIAIEAYRIADAMLKSRTEPKL